MTNRIEFLKKHNLDINKSYSLKQLSKISNIPLDILQQVFNRGVGAWETNPESVRSKSMPNKRNVKKAERMSKEQWAMARVYSFLNKGRTYQTTDFDLAKFSLAGRGGGIKLTQDVRKTFNSFFNDLFHIVDYHPKNLQLNGSFGQKLKALYASDIDLYERISIKEFDNWYNTTYQEVQKELKDVLIELKIGNTKFKKFINDKDQIFKLLHGGDRKMVKIDFYLEIEKLPTECSMLYDFDKMLSKHEFIKSIMDKIVDTYKEENYFKCFKKLYSLLNILKVDKESDKIRFINKILVSPLYANIYLLKSKIDTIIRIGDKNKKAEYDEIIKERLRKLFGNFKFYSKNYKTLYNRLNTYLNNQIYRNYVDELNKILIEYDIRV